MVSARPVAKRLAADGAAVALTFSVSAAQADEIVHSIKTAGGNALAIKAVAPETEAVRLAVAKTVGTFGSIDILVNNAGTGMFAPIEEFALKDFKKLIAVNVRGLFVSTQEAARQMREGGRIIHIGSTNSERMPLVGGSVYALTKGAVAGVTRGLARDLGPRGITVNNVQPGPIDTDANPADSDFANTLVPITALLRQYRRDREPCRLPCKFRSQLHHRRESVGRRRLRRMRLRNLKARIVNSHKHSRNTNQTMKSLRIAIIIGSTRPGRNGEAVAKWVYEIAHKRTDAEFELVDIKDFSLPLLDEPVPASMGQYSKPHTKTWAARIGSFDGYVFVTPEYNHSISGALKNAIDFLFAEWNDKAAGFVSYGGAGGARAVEQLRLVLAEVQIATVRNQVLLSMFTDFENFRVFKPDARHEQSVNAVFDQVIAWGGALKTLREKQAQEG